MQELEQDEQITRLSLNEIFVILFKHKGKILLSLAAGLAALVVVYFMFPPPYESEAKLMVRYFVDRSGVDSLESQVKTSESASQNDNLIASETEILTSWDLAEQVAGAISAERLVPGSKGVAGRDKVARGILSGLRATATRGSNVIVVSYKNRDPKLAVQVLQELINRYFVKHLEVHRSASAFEYVSQETDQVRARLDQIEVELKGLKAKAGVISLAESTTSLNVEMAKSRGELHAAEAEEAEQRARVGALEGWFQAADRNRPADAPAPAQVSKDLVEQHMVLVTQLAHLRQAKIDLLSKYTPESKVAKINQVQIETLEKQKLELEKNFSGLAFTAAPVAAAGQGTQLDPSFEKARLAALQGKVEALKSQLLGYKEEAALLSEVGPQIAQLERKKEVEEGNYKYFLGSLEKARIDEALDPSKIPNISIVQKPSPASGSFAAWKKIILGLMVGSLALGLSLAFVTELGLDRTVRRPIELETMRVPRMLSIPDLTLNGYAKPRLHSNNGDQNSSIVPAEIVEGKKAPWDEGHFIRPFCESLRDRLILYFLVKNMTHKPKLVAVTGCSKGAGTSTLAGGLAAALSETGDGKVLLVDMNAGHEEIHPFFEGRHSSSLTEAIQSGSRLAATADNLYLARASSESLEPAQLIPRKFYDLVPRLKASDFDYIIFDMPPLDQTSTTLAMAGFMDKVLLVVEAEKSNRNSVKRNYEELAAAKANVSAVLNKSRTYGPKWLNDGI